MNWSREGVVTLAAGSCTVAGHETKWLGQVQAGEGLDAPDGRIYEIAEVTSHSELVLVHEYLGASVERSSYQIIPNASMTKELTKRVSSLIATQERMTADVHVAYEFTKEKVELVAEFASAADQSKKAAANWANAADISSRSAAADSDAAMGYRNETRQLREAARVDGQSAEQSQAGALAAMRAAESARDDALGVAVSVDPNFLRDRGNHTGTQAISTVEGLAGALNARVPMTSVTGSVAMPAGPDDARDEEPGLGYTRYSTTQGGLEFYDGKDWKPVAGSGQPLLHIDQHQGSRDTIPMGTIPGDGQTVADALYPEATAAVRAGKVYTVTEAVWQASPLVAAACFSLGVPGTYWRPPNLNSVGSNAVGSFVRAGDMGARGGTAVMDATQRVTGAIGFDNGFLWARPAGGSGVLSAGSSAFNSGRLNTEAIGGAITADTKVVFDNALVVRTANEERVKTIYAPYYVRVFGAVSNPGSVNAAQLATDFGVLAAQVASDTGFAILYPNGGTAAAPANVTTNSRYVMPNPFPGFNVICIAELDVGGWGSPGWIYLEGGWGVMANLHGNDIVVQTGSNQLYGSSSGLGNPFGITVTGTLTRACRVKVWKVKGAI